MATGVTVRMWTDGSADAAGRDTPSTWCVRTAGRGTWRRGETGRTYCIPWNPRTASPVSRHRTCWNFRSRPVRVTKGHCYYLFSSPEPKNHSLFQREIIKKSENILMKNLKILFSRTTGPISTKVGTKHSWMNEIHYCKNEGPTFFQGEIIMK